MKPIAIFQHTHVGVPGAVIPVLDELSLPWVIVPVMDGAPIPKDPEAYGGIVLMGGSMGVNDGLDWIDQEIRFVRRAHEAGLPVVGHCLGAQLLARALDAQVMQGPRMEIGWQPVRYEDTPEVEQWFGRQPPEEVFQWHQDILTLPAGAQRLAASDVAPNQAFVFAGRHLGMQFHLEMTPELVANMVQANRDSLERELARGNPSTNSHEALTERLTQRLQAQYEALRSAYARWARNLR